MRKAWDERWRLRLNERRHAETRGEPNRFLVATVEGLKPAPGRALDLACGAGRNAVWLAQRGWRVVGVDFSEVALASARRLATERGVDVEWVAADLLSYEPERGAFGLVIVLYLQLSARERQRVLSRAAPSVAPGGTLLVVGHDPTNIGAGYGGPSDPGVLYTALEAAGDLDGLVVERAERVERPVPTDQGQRVALDSLVVARRPHA